MDFLGRTRTICTARKMMIRRALIAFWMTSFCLLNGARADSPQAEKQPFNLEIGVGIGASHGSQGLPETFTARWLFGATLGYHIPHWFFGVTTRGAFTDAGDTTIYGSQVTERGHFAHRSIEYGLVTRRYFGDHWYAQLAGGLAYNEATTSESTLTPDPSPYWDRFYLDGTWLQGAVGYEFPDSPWFVRLEHTYTFYYRSKIIGTDKGVNIVIDDQNVIAGNPHEHIFTLVMGLANIF